MLRHPAYLVLLAWMVALSWSMAGAHADAQAAAFTVVACDDPASDLFVPNTASAWFSNGQKEPDRFLTDLVCGEPGDVLFTKASEDRTFGSNSINTIAALVPTGTRIVDFTLSLRTDHRYPAPPTVAANEHLYAVARFGSAVTGGVFWGSGNWGGEPVDTIKTVAPSNWTTADVTLADAEVTRATYEASVPGSVPASARSLELSVGCRPVLCKTGSLPVSLILKGSRVTLDDDTVPTVTVGSGGLSSAEVNKQFIGSEGIAVKATDGTGIRQAALWDVTRPDQPKVLREWPFSCKAWLRDSVAGSVPLSGTAQPCETTIDSLLATKPAEFPDEGERRLEVRATDAVGNVGSSGVFDVRVASSPRLARSGAQPTIRGSARIGSRLVAARGTWTGEPRTFAISWQSRRAGGEWGSIGGATASAFRPTKELLGREIRVAVTASNDRATVTAVSKSLRVRRALVPDFKIDPAPKNPAAIRVRPLLPGSTVRMSRCSARACAGRRSGRRSALGDPVAIPLSELGITRLPVRIRVIVRAPGRTGRWHDYRIRSGRTQRVATGCVDTRGRMRSCEAV